MMPPDSATTAAQFLRAPRAAAIAGILFSLLLMASVWLLRESLPQDPLEAGTWLQTSSQSVATALHLIPFAGISFLWFIGVLRDRLGAREDRLFATVFLGSGLLFLAMLFFSAAVVGGLVVTYTAEPTRVLGSATFSVARAISYEVMNVYAVRMAGVFMIATSTLALRTGFIARWIALVGYALALLLLLTSRYIDRLILVFPLWVLLTSCYMLLDDLRRRAKEKDPQDFRSEG
ncbi:hypothetical protein [Candidatus Accumulibacter regalis]|jgi:hypothetical protein|uniref:DUF4386 family protein n=1 Tax=Accumulibacter regalis TaxID=522306 RepID=C7RM45_ACCRE